MKRLSLSALALLALFGLLLTGCPSPSNTPDPEPDPEPIVVSHPADINFASTLTGTWANGGYGTAEVVADPDYAEVGSVGHLVAGSWMSASYTYAAPVDISGKKVKITLRFGTGYTGTAQSFKIILVTDDTHQSEMTANDVGNIDFCDPTITTYTSYTANDVWTAYQIANPADYTSIAKVTVNPQGGAGDIYIQKIEYVD